MRHFGLPGLGILKDSTSCDPQRGAEYAQAPSDSGWYLMLVPAAKVQTVSRDKLQIQVPLLLLFFLSPKPFQNHQLLLRLSFCEGSTCYGGSSAGNPEDAHLPGAPCTSEDGGNKNAGAKARRQLHKTTGIRRGSGE